MDKKTVRPLTIFTYWLLAFSIIFPILFFIMSAVIAIIWGLAWGDATINDGLAFKVILVGLPLSIIGMVLGIILSSMLKICVKQKALLWFTLVSIGALTVLFYQVAVSPLKPGADLFMNTAILFFSYPSWVYFGYLALFLGAIAHWIYKIYRGS